MPSTNSIPNTLSAAFTRRHHKTDENGNDVWDGNITNEDLGNIFSDRYGMLAVALGAMAMVLVFLILLTLCLAYQSERRRHKEDTSDA